MSQDPNEKGASDPEADGRGLLLVDLHHLGRTFSFRRYREDILGFLAAWLVVALLISLASWTAWVGSQ
jgi:hypothetical protein